MIFHSHSWDNWRWMPATTDGTEATIDRLSETYRFADDSGVALYFYKRECQVCTAVERAERLQPDGAREIFA